MQEDDNVYSPEPAETHMFGRNRNKKLIGKKAEYRKKGAKRKTMPLKTFSRDGNKCFVIFLNLCFRERRNK